MGKEVYCSSSRALSSQRAGVARRSRTTHRLWQKLCARNVASDVRVASCVRASSARAAEKCSGASRESVWVRCTHARTVDYRR